MYTTTLPLLFLLPSFLPLPALATPLPSPEPIAVYIPHVDASASTNSRRAVSLSHTPAYVSRAKHAALSKRGLAGRSTDQEWLLREAAKVDTRYNGGSGGFGALLALGKDKRAGEVGLTDHNLDASYSGQVSVGTPAQTFDIILDTGSSDLWIAASGCSTCSNMDTFDSSKSSSNVATNTTFAIQYGSGTASGKLMQDTVTLGGYSVAAQTFAACGTIQSGLISSSVSGIMGLSWQSLAYSKAVPWWLTLAKSGSWDDPLFGFYLKRYRNAAGASTTETDGGTATFGYLDSSLYTGDVTYVSVASDAEYWQIPMAKMTVQGTSISLGSSNQVAVDTGTTLIGGPSAIIASIYAAIPGSRQMSGSYQNYYEYPCSTTIDFQLTFGDFTIEVSDADFNLGHYSSDTSYCTGAAFIQSLPSGTPIQWIVGDTALKNVYSVYRYSPAAVGFANLPGAVVAAASSVSTTIVDATTISESATASRNASATGSASASLSGKVLASQTASSASPVVVTATAVVAATASSNSAEQASSSSGSTSGAAQRLSAGMASNVFFSSACLGAVALLLGGFV